MDLSVSAWQAKLAEYNRNGSTLQIHSAGTYRELVAEWRVVAVANKDRIGLAWKPVGYGEEMQDLHAMWFSAINVVDALATGEWLWVEMDDDFGRHYVLDTILMETELEDTWQKWLAYRAERADWYRTLDRNMAQAAKELLDLK